MKYNYHLLPMSFSKKEQKITIASELTLFGGLAKMQIPLRIGSGVSAPMDIPSLLTMQYLSPKLKIYKLERVKSAFEENYYDATVEYPLVNFDTDHPFSNERESLGWRETIWSCTVYRSLEIWKELSLLKIGASIGGVTQFGAKSLQGKLGSNNGTFVKKNSNGGWELIVFKQTKVDKAFKPFSNYAIRLCFKRAKALKQKKDLG